MEALRLKLVEDLTIKLKQYIHEKGINLSEEEIVELINKRVPKEPFDYQRPTYSEHLCQARIWQKGLQCTHAKKNGDYCDKHNRMIKIDGLLRFGDIREERPAYDLIKQQQGDLVRLQWIEPDPMKRLQNLLDKQQQKIINSTSRIYL